MATYATEQIRTVALVGQGGAGQDHAGRSAAGQGGAIPAAGSVERGTTVCDFDPLEKQYQHSLRSSLLHLRHGETRAST